MTLYQLRLCIILIFTWVSSVVTHPLAFATESDQIKLTFLGTGAPRPSHDRYGPSILVEAGNHTLLVDAGPGMRERLFQAGGFEILTKVDQILITHLHFNLPIAS